DRDDGQGSYNRLVGQAAEDAALGKNESAIKHYSAALRLAPEDNASAYNLVALLLQKAALYDAQRDWVNAAKTYEKALRLWGENDQTAAAIRTRLDWVKQKQRAASIEAEKAD
ncbi:MAG TPA: hypothetical protein VHB73_03615, partial [Alphaproteobacteria bacterium]|nr:hypothetical protein [Alphaproteobacteria bacterium]